MEWDGVPTGLASADNARTLVETSVSMANFRCELVAEDGSVDHVASPSLTPPVDGLWVETAFSGVPQAHAGTQVEFTIMAIADHSGSTETLSLRIGSTNFGVVLGQSGSDCVMASRTTLIPAASYNAAIGDGETTFRITASAALDPVCTGSEMRYVVRYREEPACSSTDSDGDGIGDLCDGCPNDPLKQAPGDCGCGVPDLDADGNGIADCLESCQGDFNRDGLVDGTDLAQLFQAWGNLGGPEDLTGDGLVDGGDLGYLLLAWGECQ